VRDLPRNPDDLAIVTGIVGLAHSLGFRTIAEGVETREQLDILRTLECDEFQGYYFSKPVPAEEFASLLARQGRAPSQGGALQAGKNPSTDR
jgi:EAL domain-containing protein (putative c-di-GMP-specific phosphodiesterase class I)